MSANNRPRLIGNIANDRHGYLVPKKPMDNNSRSRAKRVDNIADHLVEKFKSPQSRDFFCKCAWKLSEDEIWTNYEKAQKKGVNSPLKLFIYLCQLEMV